MVRPLYLPLASWDLNAGIFPDTMSLVAKLNGAVGGTVKRLLYASASDIAGIRHTCGSIENCVDVVKQKFVSGLKSI